MGRCSLLTQISLYLYYFIFRFIPEWQQMGIPEKSLAPLQCSDNCCRPNLWHHSHCKTLLQGRILVCSCLLDCWHFSSCCYGVEKVSNRRKMGDLGELNFFNIWFKDSKYFVIVYCRHSFYLIDTFWIIKLNSLWQACGLNWKIKLCQFLSDLDLLTWPDLTWLDLTWPDLN